MARPPDFETLVAAHSAEIFGYLWRLLRDTSDAEDCLQDTFLRALRAYPRLDGRTHQRAWLYKIATNVARTHARRRTRTAARTAALDPDSVLDHSSVPEQVHQRSVLAAVARAVEALPHQQRAALILRQYQELSYAAIAAALDCTEAAARANVYQALQKLRAQFSERDE
jgi:RNA polymerase sigma-70 factor (ECF subfamily)